MKYFHIHSYTFADSIQTLQSLIYTSSSPSVILSCHWLVYDGLTTIKVLPQCEKLKNIRMHWQKSLVFTIWKGNPETSDIIN
jgi:hypothetical protein